MPGGSDLADDATAARVELWRRHDAGDIGADELEARLLSVDAASTPADVSIALDGGVPIRRALGMGQGRRLLVAVAGVVAVVMIGAAIALVSSSDDREAGGDDPVVGIATTAVGIAPLPVPVGECALGADLDSVAEGQEEADQAVLAPTLLSDPPATPEGYTVTDDFPVEGVESDIVWSTSAGSEPLVASHGRMLDRDDAVVHVEMRAFAYADAESATRSAASTRAAICGLDAEIRDVAGVPGGNLILVSSPIAGAFASFRSGDRRVTVAAYAADLEDAAIAADAVLTTEWQALTVPR